jgi:antitoxin HicB
MQEVTYTVHIEPGDDHGYIAFFPALPGCHTEGETVEQTIAMAKEALAGYLAVLIEDGENLPVEKSQAKRVGFEIPLSAAPAR